MANFTETIKETFPGKQVVIVGDLVADQFLHGTIERVSREAPVFILNHEHTDTRAGGAANAAVNVASLGGQPILIGLTGNDINGKLLGETLKSSNVDCSNLVESKDMQTTTKLRVLAGQHYAARQQVIRIDYQNRADIDNDLRLSIKQKLAAAAANADAIIISDYNYGVADAETVALARQLANERDIPLLIDSRFRFDEFSGATTATPNQEEVEQILGKDFSTENCEKLRERLGYEALLVTCGNKGMQLFEKGKPMAIIDAVGSLEPVDVTGAGDTVIGVYALGLASGLSFLEAANLANYAGGIVVMKKGTASVSVAELIHSIEANPSLRISGSSV